MLGALVPKGSLYAGGSGCLGCCQVSQGSFFNNVTFCALFAPSCKKFFF